VIGYFEGIGMSVDGDCAAFVCELFGEVPDDFEGWVRFDVEEGLEM
jgi:hypothetical protein